MNEQEVIKLMQAAISESDWNAKCDQVKKTCEGYPEFWFKAILSSGLMAEVSSSW